jgi:hypothetical protein
MRGRWASAALGAGMARRQASYEMEQQAQAYEAQQQQAQQQIVAQQWQIEALVILTNTASSSTSSA